MRMSRPCHHPAPVCGTHTVVMGLMALAYRVPRRDACWPSCPGLAHHAPYDADQDEITRPLEDPPSLIRRLSNPPSAPEPLLCPTHRSPHGGQLSLSEAAVQVIRQIPADVLAPRSIVN